MAKTKERDGQREAKWRTIIRDCSRSGLTVREFCRRGKLKESAFYFWRRQLLERQAEQEQRRQPDSPARPRFVTVRVEPQEPAASGGMQIVLRGGCRVHVTAPVDRQALADVLAALEGRPC